MSASPKMRAFFACCALACCFTGFSARLVHLQVAMHDEYTARAADNHDLKQTIYARRGSILDATGQPLAQNEPVKTVVADASLIKDRAAVARLLSGPLAMPEKEIVEKLNRERWSEELQKNTPSRYIVLKREVSEAAASEIATKLASSRERGILFEQDSVRVYPNGEMLCHVLGSINHDNNGIDVIERSMNHDPRGHDGFRYTERDRTGKEIVAHRGQERPPRDGSTVRLTIDAALQNIVESEMDAAVKQYRPKMAVCILMRPQTGEVVALVNRPHFNLNQTTGVNPEHRKNRAIADQVEPGSTFKIVTTAAALAQKLVRPDTYIFCENGYFPFGGRALHDHHGYGSLSVHEILVKSSNIGVAKLAIQMGEHRLYDTIRRWGFGEPTGINLPGEIGGTVHLPHNWTKISITRIPMGHEVASTPLQIVNAMCAIANGGRLMMPQIVRDVIDTEGATIATFPPVEVRRVVPEETAAQVRDALMEVVSKKGTAPLAVVPGFKVAGKTGTAEKITPGGSYKDGKYVASFVGFMPAENPEFVGLVLMDEAQAKRGEHYGGFVAAPVFARIGERAARYLCLTPTPEAPDGGTVLAAETRN